MNSKTTLGTTEKLFPFEGQELSVLLTPHPGGPGLVDLWIDGFLDSGLGFIENCPQL